jgi:hypothetical protein
MKNCMLLLFLTVIISCNNSKESQPKGNSTIQPLENNEANVKQINDLLNSLNDNPQIFNVSSNKPTVVKGKKGMKVYIDPNDLETENGNPVNGQIKVELIEATESKDFIKNNIPTISNGKILITGGAYFVQAYSNGEKLKLKKSKSLKIDLPRITDSEMELFLGERKTNGSINWISVNQNLIKDTTQKPIKPIEKKPLTKYYKKKSNDINEILNYVEGGQIDTSSNQQQVVEVTKEEYEKYLFEKAEYEKKLSVWKEEANTYSQVELKNFGWINCDRFISDELPLINTIVKFENDSISQVKTILVFKDINSVLETVASNEKGRFVAKLDNIPKDKKVSVLSIGVQSEKCFYNEQEVTIGNQTEIAVTLREITKGELKKRINKYQ